MCTICWSSTCGSLERLDQSLIGPSSIHRGARQSSLVQPASVRCKLAFSTLSLLDMDRQAARSAAEVKCPGPSVPRSSPEPSTPTKIGGSPTLRFSNLPATAPHSDLKWGYGYGPGGGVGGGGATRPGSGGKTPAAADEGAPG